MIAERLALHINSGLLTGMSGEERIELVDTRCSRYENLSTGERQLLDIAALAHELETAPTSHMDSDLSSLAGRALMELAGRFVSEPWHPSDEAEVLADRRAELAGDL